MRFKRMIAALLSAAIYMTAGAAAAELPQDAAETETTAVTTETAAERDLTQDLPQARAVVSAAKTTHAFQLNGKAVTDSCQLSPGDVVETRLAKGRVEAKTVAVYKG